MHARQSWTNNKPIPSLQPQLRICFFPQAVLQVISARLIFTVPIRYLYAIMLKIFILSITAFFSFAAAQSGYLGGTLLFDNTTCVTGPNTTFANCNAFYSTLGNCTSNTTSAVLASCECTQPFFNLIVEYVLSCIQVASCLYTGGAHRV
jgi:hypothetical protein